jgi:hypothetical protein
MAAWGEDKRTVNGFWPGTSNVSSSFAWSSPKTDEVEMTRVADKKGRRSESNLIFGKLLRRYLTLYLGSIWCLSMSKMGRMLKLVDDADSAWGSPQRCYAIEAHGHDLQNSRGT